MARGLTVFKVELDLAVEKGYITCLPRMSDRITSEGLSAGEDSLSQFILLNIVHPYLSVA